MSSQVTRTLSPLVSRFKEYNSQVDWLVFLLICLYTMGSWIDSYGIWTQLPIMVHILPEEERLYSFTVLVTQAGQIGPIIFLLGHRFLPKYFTFENVTRFILAIGALSCFLLAKFWTYTFSGYSVGYLSLNFALSLLDGTSTVVFVPYIGEKYDTQYLIPNYVGESLAAFVPGLLSLIQNFDVNIQDISNATSHEQIKIIESKLLFSVMTYMIMMGVLLCICMFAFTLLVHSRRGKNERAKFVKQKQKKVEKFCLEEGLLSAGDQHKVQVNGSTHITQKTFYSERVETALLSSLVFISVFLCFGLLPSLQVYAISPYGHKTLTYSTNISLVLMPISILLSIWSYRVSVIRIVIEFSISIAFGVYIVVLAFMSPHPFFIQTTYGPMLVTIAWIVSQLVSMRVRCLIATRLERFGTRALFINGICTMTGQVFSAILGYFITGYLDKKF